MAARVFILSMLLLLSFGVFAATQAQPGQNCPTVIQNAIDAIGNNCGQLDRNSACYGFQQVLATFNQPQSTDFFSHPADRTQLDLINNLDTGPLNTTQNQWGIALMSVQANLPDTLPGQNVIFMLMGNTEVEDAVPPDQTFKPGPTVNVTTQIGADLYYEPNFNAKVVASAPQNAMLSADAITATGDWVRVVYNSIPGWITRQVIAANTDLSTLAVMGPDTKTPMQAFYFHTSISGTNCTQAPDSLVIQGPKNLTVDIQANGADIRLGSTIALRLVPIDPAMRQSLTDQFGDIGNSAYVMQVIVLDGHVVLNPDSPNPVELSTGETTFTCLTSPENLGDDGLADDRSTIPQCSFLPPRPMTYDELAPFLALNNDVTLNYTITLPDIPPPSPTPTDTFTPTNTRIFSRILPTATPTDTDTPVPQQPPQQPPPPRPTRKPTSTPTATPIPCDTFTFPYTVNGGDNATLIAAINAANDERCHPGQDTINLGGDFTFSAVDNSTDGPNALPDITSAIIINGGDAVVAGDSDTTLRLFHVSGSGSLTLNHVKVEFGLMFGFSGGGIYNAGTLALSESELLHDRADNGGGLYNTGSASFNASTVAIGEAGSGGGIYNAGTLNMLNSTISDNSGDGGPGLGLYNTGSATLNFVTVFNNAGNGGNGIDAPGGSVTAWNTLVGASGGNCSGNVSGPSTSFSDADACSGFTQGVPLGLDPSLAYNNGAPTQTHALQGGSAAIDTDDCLDSNGSAVSVDQTGTTRPQDTTSDTSTACDAGSFEFVPSF